MNENKYRGTTLDFWQLLQNQKIEIPIIQRDYAQGRKDKRELRDNFLTALYDSLEKNNSIKLDFIYGSNEDGAFQPLDGQQRLTTLFLLHWYALKKDSGNNSDDVQLLKRFTYETRISSREFCNAIVDNPIGIEENKILSESIIDSSWFFLSWKSDPTIDAMLRTIDDIHAKFFNIENLRVKLSTASGLISFYHVELEDIGLTDDLYIKMNARGKLLSPFENFKASFQKLIIDKNWEQSKGFLDTFACKIDTIWTDLFWQHRKENSIDEAFMRFISCIAMLRQSLEKSDDRINTISKLQENPNNVRAEIFSEEGFLFLCDCFDLYSNLFKENIDISINMPLWQHSPDGTLFSALVFEDNQFSTLQRNSASYSQKILFYAQTEYLLRTQNFNRTYFLDWMRVIRNIVSRGDISKYGDRPAIIRSPQAFDGVVNLINELAEGCGNIYHFLAQKDLVKSAFAREQIEEEKLKAKLILHNSSYKEPMVQIENTNLFQGRIDFALFTIDIDKDNLSLDEKLLSDIHKVILRNFEEDINDDFRRAMLTIEVNGHYKFYEYWWSFWNVVSAHKRCLFDKYRELEYFIYGNYKNRDEYKIYFKKLLLNLVGADLKSISQNFAPPPDMPLWKIRLIKEPLLLNEKCKSHYIAIPEDESCCYLLKSLRPRDLDGCEKIE
ncbi:DUF262 domain-containing protein [Mucilaginibacter achroorhodeus]|uniref:DUF262 domain-containing protein n=1 Tax=Mucilaginibacter achroorhodeus TaxID=2599294 RepID=A0A563U1Q5_9SPHI|nr:DUF262 domain-containing protein [Mucilaginibacter achroorhodeus]TWR25493.1 DUF262 domain-containing protein [Mucilaginibacter achroorhodeus]